MEPKSDDPLPTRLSLLARVKDVEDSESWAEFFRTYERMVRGLARQRGLTEDEADDVAQEVFRRVAKTIHDFERGPYAGSFRKWLGRLTRWRADDKLRERRRAPIPVSSTTGPDDPDPVESLSTDDDPARAFEAEARKYILETLIKRLEAQVPSRDLQIFQLITIEGMAPDAVAEMFGLKRSHVYVLKHRILEKLKVEARKLPLGPDAP